MTRLIRTAAVLSVLTILATTAGGAEPLAEKYLLSGDLAGGVKALEARLAEAPDDDQARVGLGVIRFLRSIERLGASLYEHGLRTETSFGRGLLNLSEVLPQNPEPKPLGYAGARRIVQAFVDDMTRVEKTLAAVKDPAVKLPLKLGRIKLDPFGRGRPASAAEVLPRFGADAATVEAFAVGFDFGDVCWLRGYCHLLSAFCELALSVDTEELFACSAHLFFEKVETPHRFLLEERRDLTSAAAWNTKVLSDLIALIHQLRLPVKEPARCKAALAHLEATLALGREMWTHIRAETDDDHEWIPNPKQTGALGVKVTNEMIDVWIETLDEAKLVLAGKRLIPFWRGTRTDRGVNLRRVFTEPTRFDPILWFQGTAATPYLEKGEMTPLASDELIERMLGAFGSGMDFMTFGFWFN